MRSKLSRAKDALPQPRLKLLLWAAVISLLFGLASLGEIVENPARALRNSLHPTKASGDIVLVAIDDATIRKVGEWPWPRARHAQLIDAVSRLGAKRIFLEGLHEGPTDRANDQALAEALARSGRVTMPVRERLGAKGGARIEAPPLPLFARYVQLASVSLFYNYQHAVLELPYAARFRGRPIPSFASALSDLPLRTSGRFRVDYSIDPASVPYVRASEVMSDRAQAGLIAGKDVIIGLDADQVGVEYWLPGHGRMAGALVHIIGAETLKQGHPIDLAFWPAWLMAVGACGFILLRPRNRYTGVLLTTTAVLLFFGTAALEANLIFVDMAPGAVACMIVGARLAWQRWKAGSFTNELTGLPNLAALRAEKSMEKQALVAARVHNYAEIGSTLDAANERTLIEQLVQRLSVNSGADGKVFQGDEGIFAWFVDTAAPLAHHLEALHGFFRSPLSVGGQTIDVALTFGVELGSSRPVANRLGSALLAAEEAWDEGLKWKYHDPARQEEVGWRLSLLGQLDAAIDNGEVWVAYQPQLDLQRNQIIGAEALARWTHPEKGPISPTEFVAAAEQQGRIGKLTDFVLDRAIATAAVINRRGIQFTVAVNISARLLADHELVERVMRFLQVHGLNPERLTLELTETEALSGAGDGIAVLDALRSKGIRIAIDDYGTGLSTLNYLKKIPANEIKIDQSFVRAMRVNRSDLVMVESTIALAHSLGRTVVAEGVEDRQLLDQLTRLECDVAQGYAIGRPMGVRELIQNLQIRVPRRVA